MRTKLTILFVLGAFISISAQIGIQYQYEVLDRPGTASTSFQGQSFGLEYWFRMKNLRLEFTPVIAYQQFRAHGPIVDNDGRFESLLIEFQAQIYPMDWENDCMCPTFGKTNDFIRKGFFLTLAPYYSHLLSGQLLENDQTYTWGVKFGIGLDIGIAQFLTLSPVARLNIAPSHYLREAGISDPLFGYNLMLKASIRLDRRNY